MSARAQGEGGVRRDSDQDKVRAKSQGDCEGPRALLREDVSLFDSGKLREEDGKIFGRIYDHLRAGNASKAREKARSLLVWRR